MQVSIWKNTVAGPCLRAANASTHVRVIEHRQEAWLSADDIDIVRVKSRALSATATCHVDRLWYANLVDQLFQQSLAIVLW